MSIARAKAILQALSNDTLTDQEMKDVVIDYISDPAALYNHDVNEMSNLELANVFIQFLRTHIRDKIRYSAGMRFDADNQAAKDAAVDAVTDIIEETGS